MQSSDDGGRGNLDLRARSPGAPLRGPLMSRAWFRFISNPASVRYAMGAIIAATLLTVVLGGSAMWLADPKTFTSIGLGMWWAVETVTTVGYGDLVPQTPVGRVVASVVMLEAVAFLTIVTASITSIFIEDRQAARRAIAAANEEAHRARLEATLREVLIQLQRLEKTAAAGGQGGMAGSEPSPGSESR